MRLLGWFVMSVLGVGVGVGVASGSAWAQVGPDAGAGSGSAAAATPPPPPPVSPPADQPATAMATAPALPPPPPPAAAPETESEEHHPVGTRFAIGAGYHIGGQSLETPNVATVRLRLPTGLTFEPIVSITNSSSTTGATGASDASTTTTDLSVGSLVRIPLMRDGRIDFELVGAALFDYHKVNPDGPDNDTSNTTFSVDWGLGMEYWITQHWNLSLTATNPLFEFQSQTVDTGPGMNTHTSTSTFGVVFDPDVFLLFHLYN